MNDLIPNNAPTMTSVELVEVINSLREEGKAELRHDHFMAKVQKVLGSDAPEFLGTQKYGNNISRQVYNLPKREASLMVMSESYAVQAKVYDRMVELESKPLALNPANFSRMQLIELAMQSEQGRLLLEAQVAEQAPKVEIHDRISESVSTLCIRDAAKTLQVQPSRLTTWLVMNKWIYHRAGKSGYLAYQDRIQSGYLVHKSTPYKDSVTGDDKISEQVRITGRGLTALAKHLTDDFSGVLKATEKKRSPPRPGQDFIQ